jgi:hypothetical protein
LVLARQSVNVFTVKPTSGGGKAFDTITPTAVRLGCTITPSITLGTASGTGDRTYSWSMDISPLPTTPLLAKFSEELPVKYTVSYTRKPEASNLTITGTVVLTNPYPRAMKLTKVVAAAPLVAGGAPVALPGSFSCPNTADGAITIPGTSVLGEGASIICKLKLDLGARFVTSIMVNVTTADGESVFWVWPRGNHDGFRV